MTRRVGEGKASKDPKPRRKPLKVKENLADPEVTRNGHSLNGQMPDDERRLLDEADTIKTYTAADIEEPNWFWTNLILKGYYTSVVGVPQAGKTTFLLHLTTKATKTLYFHGDEKVPLELLQRVITAGTDPNTVKWVAPSCRWLFPFHKDRLVLWIRHLGVDLVIFDPIDPYIEPPFDSNDDFAVRRLLDCFAEVAHLTGVALLIVRHPGKHPENLFPNSRAWEAHPRAVILLQTSPSTRHSGILVPYRPPLGRPFPSTRYTLPLRKDGNRTFVLGRPVGQKEAAIANAVRDPFEREKISIVRDLLKGLLPGGSEMNGRDILSELLKEGFSESTVRRAKELEGILHHRSGTRKETRSVWKYPKGRNMGPKGGGGG